MKITLDRLKPHLFPALLAAGLVTFQLVMAAPFFSGGAWEMEVIGSGLMRAAAAVFLAFMIHAAAQSVTADEREARLGALLATAGVGLGWLHGLLVSALDLWGTGVPSPDVTGPFAVIPAMLTGPGVILSLALLLFVMRGGWEAIHDRSRAPWLTGVAIVALGLVRPELLPLAVMAVGMAWMKKLGRQPAQTRTHVPALTLATFVLAGIAAALLFHGTEGLGARVPLNALPAGGWDRWLFAVVPAAGAFIWVAVQHDRFVPFFARSRWCLGWILAALILLLLPVPWRTVMLTGLMIPLVLLSLPAWRALWGRMPRGVGILLLIFAVGVTPLFLVISQMARVR